MAALLSGLATQRRSGGRYEGGGLGAGWGQAGGRLGAGWGQAGGGLGAARTSTVSQPLPPRSLSARLVSSTQRQKCMRESAQCLRSASRAAASPSASLWLCEGAATRRESIEAAGALV